MFNGKINETTRRQKRIKTKPKEHLLERVSALYYGGKHD